MSRITSQAAHLSVGPEANFLSNAQLHLDASLEGFSRQATHAQSIAALSLAGIVGQGARLGFLSLGAGRVFAQIGSVGLEALSLVGIEHWNAPSPTLSFSQSYVHSALNIAVFRIFSPFHAANPLLRQGLQASALVSAHHAAVWAGFEEKNTLSFTQEMTQALATNLTFHVGAGLGQFLLGGRLGIVQRRTELLANQPASIHSQENHAQPLLNMGAERGRVRRFATSLAARVAPKVSHNLDVQNHREVLNQILPFSQELARVVREQLSVVENYPSRITLKDLRTLHGRLLPENPSDYRGFFRRRLSEFRTAIVHYENLQTYKISESAASQETILAIPKSEPLTIPKLFSYFNWSRRLYLRLFPRASHSDSAHAAPGFPVEAPVSAEDLSRFHECCAEIYDNLVLLQEAVRVVRQAQAKIAAEDAPQWDAFQSTYDELHEKLHERRDAFRRATTQFYQMDNADFFYVWTQPFIERTTNLRVSRNLQTLLGNVVLVQGEHVGGSIWGGIQKNQRAGQAFQSLRTFYDAESAQLVAFDDPRSTLSKRTVANLRARGRTLVPVNYIIDTAESGQIIDALIEAPVSENCSKIIKGLIGLQLAKNDPIFAHSDLHVTQDGRIQLPRGERTYSFSNLTEYENRGDLYRVIDLTPRQGTPLSVVTLVPANGTESDNAQLVLQRKDALRLPRVGGYIRVKKIEG